MKKNILLVQSLLLLPLISSSYMFGMEEKTYAAAVQADQKKPAIPTKKRKKKQTNKQVSTATEVVNKSQNANGLDKTVDEKAALIKQREEEAKAKRAAIKLRVESSITEEVIADARLDLNMAKALIDKSLLLTIKSLGKDIKLNSTQKTISQEEVVEAKKVDINTIKIDITTDLEASILSPSEYKGFGLTDQIWNAFKSNRGIVLRLLQSETFDVANAAHTERFNTALEECAQHQDLDSLAGILNICRTKEKYKSLQSAINHVAPVFNFLCDEYQAQINTSNVALAVFNKECAEQVNERSQVLKEEMARLLNQHRNTVTTIAHNFETKIKEEQKKAKELQVLISGISALNTKVQEKQNVLLFDFPLEIPNNSVKAIEEKAHQNIRHLLTHANMPQAQILQINNK